MPLPLLTEFVSPPLPTEPQDLVCCIDMFSSLPLSSAREVLELTRRETFAPGTHIVRKGDRGEAFYVIASGVAEVQVATKAARSDSGATSGADGAAAAEEVKMFSKFFRVGDYFGEQALMIRNVRRGVAPRRPGVQFVLTWARAGLCRGCALSTSWR